MSSSFDVKGKTAIITGGGSGINFAFGKLLLSKGCNVVIADLALRPEAQEFYSEHTSTPRAVFAKTDVTSWTALESMFATAISEFGRIDILCAGAGIFDPPFSNFWYPPGSKESRDDPKGDRYLTMDINVIHPIRATQLALSHFMNPPEGQEQASPSNPKRVVICGSIAGQLHGISYPLYFASKHAVSAFVRSLGDLYAKLGIKVAAVAPGGVRTPLLVENEHKARTINFEKDELCSPEFVAENLYKLLVDDNIEGGTMLEVGAREYTRVVPAFNNPGPTGPGNSVSNYELNITEVYDQLGTAGWGQTK